MYNYLECPVCKSKTFKNFISCIDHTVSHKTFQLSKCTSCDFVFTNPLPDLASLGEYYKSEDYISHSNTKRGLIAKLYHLVRNYTLKNKLALLSAHVSRGTILDYGCGTGLFLKTCSEAGWKTMGMEPDSGARRLALGQGLDVAQNNDDLSGSLEGKQVDAISLWHVLEHVTELDATLSLFKSKLSSDGTLIIAVPNYKSHDADKYGSFWAAYDVPRHLYHFEPKTLCLLLSNYGFKLVETKPMKFDSFYVSMLSEKYKHNKINYYKAFLSGLSSNTRANTTGNYSSLIYVFKHQ